MHSQETYDHDHNGSCHHGRQIAKRLFCTHAHQGARYGGTGIDMFGQDIRFFLRHNVSQEAASHTGQDTDKDGQKQRMIPCIPCRVDPHNGKDSKTDGIGDIH